MAAPDHSEALSGGMAAFDEAIQARSCPYLNQMGEMALREMRDVYQQLDAGNYDALEDLADRLAAAVEQNANRPAPEAKPEPATDKPPTTLKAETADAPPKPPLPIEVIAPPAAEPTARTARQTKRPETIESTNPEPSTPEMPQLLASAAEVNTSSPPEIPPEVIRLAERLEDAAAEPAEPEPETGLVKSAPTPTAEIITMVEVPPAELERPATGPPNDEITTEPVVAEAEASSMNQEPAAESSTPAAVAIVTTLQPAPENIGQPASPPPEVIEAPREAVVAIDQQGPLPPAVTETGTDLPGEEQAYFVSTETEAIIEPPRPAPVTAEARPPVMPETEEDVPLPAAPLPLEQIREQADDQPLELTMAQLTEALAEPEPSPEEVQLKTILKEIEALLPAEVIGSEESEEAVITVPDKLAPELESRLIDLLESVGYSRPRQALAEFTDRRGLPELIKTVDDLCRPGRDENQPDILEPAGLAASGDDGQPLRLGRALLALIGILGGIRPRPAA